MSARQWTQEDLQNAFLYGVCLICMTPHELRETVTETEGRTERRIALIKPCGHNEREIDAELERMS